ncbi:hypothetical protein AABB24_017280 [Solanum stoloniferum]|uniref:RRM domain-containing protein n=1 Tax=Solanum stoloniferum TaxID=62892 RepID=A0ABD2TLM3_9SOLN
MSAEVEYRCFVGGLAWATNDRTLGEAFSQYDNVVDSKVHLLHSRDQIRYHFILASLITSSLYSLCYYVTLLLSLCYCYYLLLLPLFHSFIRLSTIAKQVDQEDLVLLPLLMRNP